MLLVVVMYGDGCMVMVHGIDDGAGKATGQCSQLNIPEYK